MTDPDSAREAVEDAYRTESRRVLATLIRLLGDFDIAEEMMHEAFAAALAQWRVAGVPANQRAWLVSAARFKAIDMMRRRGRHDVAMADMMSELDPHVRSAAELSASGTVAESSAVDDDQLRLVFMCCHPALSPDAQVALTLREVCGLTTEEIAHAFLSSAPTIAQRIVRAKSKIRDAGIPFDLPEAEALPERMHSVLNVVYLVFNEGYAAAFGDALTRADLCTEAIRLARLVNALLPHPDVQGLLALMLLHDARRNARSSLEGDVILLEDQDRSVWDAPQIAEGLKLIQNALAAGSRTSHSIQAAIVAVHAEAENAAATDWPQILALYDVLMNLAPSPVVALNRAVAVSMVSGPDVALRQVEQLFSDGHFADYYPAHLVSAELCRRAGRTDEAIAHYRRAALLTGNAPARRFVGRRMNELVNTSP